MNGRGEFSPHLWSLSRGKGELPHVADGAATHCIVPASGRVPARSGRVRAAWRLVAMALLAASVLPTAAAAQGSPSGEVTEYGIYELVDGKPRLEQQTGRIPARKGTRFGFCAQLRGLDDVNGKTMLSEVVRHPLLTHPNGIESNGWNAPHMVTVTNGRGYWCGGHELREDWQLVPGKWRFVVSDGVRDLVVQEFEVVPDGK